jgi:hypothetical protein
VEENSDTRANIKIQFVGDVSGAQKMTE